MAKTGVLKLLFVVYWFVTSTLYFYYFYLFIFFTFYPEKTFGFIFKKILITETKREPRKSHKKGNICVFL